MPAPDGQGEFERWFDLSTDLLAVVAADGRTLRLSRSWTKVLGYPMATLMSTPLANLVHPDDRIETADVVERYLVSGAETPGFINRYIHADGSVRWFEWSGHAVGHAGDIFAIARDITEGQLRTTQDAQWAAALRAVLAARTLDELLPVVTEQARTLIGVRLAAISVAATPGSEPTFTVVQLGPEHAPWRGQASARVSALAAEVCRTNEPIRLTHQALEAHPLYADWQASFAGDPPVRGWLACPVINRAGVNVGLIQMSSKEDGTEFGAADQVRLQELTRVASLAIERARVLAESTMALARQQLVVELGQAALGDVELAEFLAHAVSSVAAMLGVATVAVAEITISTDSVLVAPLAAVPDGIPAVSFSHADFYPSIPAMALRTGRPAVEADCARQPHALGVEMMTRYGLRSAIAVPMTNTASFTGVLYAADAQPLRFGDGELAFLQQVANVLAAAIGRDASQQRIIHQATHDALTGLPNRGMLRAALEETVANALLASRTTGLLLLDLDGFKDVNDSLGHAAGDIVLEQLAKRLRVAAGEGALVARLGGDEFAVCFDGPATGGRLELVAAGLTESLTEPFDADGVDVTLSASIGLVLAPDHGTDASTLLRHADVAMYRAKADRTSWVVYDEGLDHARAVRLTSISELRAAICAGDLEVHYQPIVALSTGQPIEMEALVRWRHPTRGLIPPALFVPLAEHSGLIGELTRCVIERSLLAASQWRAAGWQLRCAVNLSVNALTHTATTAELVRLIIEQRDWLTVEITESALADARARRTLRELAAAGVACAIDDFGTGYSSLAALKSLPVSTVKIDREFVRDLDRSHQDFAIVTSVAQLAAALSLSVIAEGVETRPTAERLQEAGISSAQGFYFARPMPVDSLLDWLSARPSPGVPKLP